MPTRLLEEALRAWRDGERLLEVLPTRTADHETVRLAVIQLRQTYQHVAALETATEEALSKNREVVQQAARAIRNVEDRLGGI